MKTRPEILAPAGSMEALRAAVECGADAVYLGAGSFNARRNAKNFSEEELAAAIEYCHVRGVKVHIACNTLVADSELPGVLSFLETCCALGADAFIVQDLGVAKLLKEAAPLAELHASTQMAVSTAEGFLQLRDLGFQRAVLPRELSFSEILDIREKTKDSGLELEMFIHGALCMCVSGQCYLSSAMGGRSGNRGLCAQPCRLRFAADGTEHALSLKDLSAVENIPALFDAGVMSFKIEGRMKRPEYVAAAVSACRNAADGNPDPERLAQLNAVFSRSGHTDGYLTETLGPGMFGTRRKDDVLSAAPVYKELASLYQKETRSTSVGMALTAALGKPLELTVWTKGEDPETVTVTTEGTFFAEPAKNAGATEEKVRAQLQKTGGTGFSAASEDITVFLEENLFLPASALNELRRKALQSLTKRICQKTVLPFSYEKAEALLSGTGVAEPIENTDHTELTTPKVPKAPKASAPSLPTLFCKFAKEDQLPFSKADFSKDLLREKTGIILPLHASKEAFQQITSLGLIVGAEIPRGLYGARPRILEEAKQAKKFGATFAYVGTLDGLALAKDAGLTPLGGPTLNLFNRVALQVYNTLGLKDTLVSTELSLRQIRDLSGAPGPRTGLFVYGRAPLMLTRNAPGGKETDLLTDRKNISFPVQKVGEAYELLNSRPLYLLDRPEDIRFSDLSLLSFTTETTEEVENILARLKTAAPAPSEFTRGLYDKGVL